MTPREWVVIGAFAGTVWALGLVAPNAALLLGGVVILIEFARGGVGTKILSGIQSVGGTA